jgi:hypothetical protein
MTRNVLSLLLLFISTAISAQTYKVQGKITTTKLEPLGFASIQVKGARQGTISQTDGTYLLLLEEGNYNLIITMIGYKPQTINITVDKDNTRNIILEEEDSQNLSEVVVKGKGKGPC